MFLSTGKMTCACRARDRVGWPRSGRRGSDSAYGFAAQRPLADSRRLLLMDRRGYGDSLLALPLPLQLARKASEYVLPTTQEQPSEPDEDDGAVQLSFDLGAITP